MATKTPAATTAAAIHGRRSGRRRRVADLI
jgi:hypothetical protein